MDSHKSDFEEINETDLRQAKIDPDEVNIYDMNHCTRLPPTPATPSNPKPPTTAKRKTITCSN